jgi:hypothetical protein
MKIKISVSLIITVICISTLFSCVSSPKAADIDSEFLIGTKWVSVLPFFGFNDTIEFIDGENCTYTLISGPKELTYKIKSDSIIIGRDRFFLEGNTFYYNGNPHWVKQN